VPGGDSPDGFATAAHARALGGHAGLPRTGQDYPGRHFVLIHDFLVNSAGRDPDQVAVIHGATRASYGSVDDLSHRLAGALVRAGIAFGDRVVLLAENSVDYVVGYYGVLRAGAIAVPLFPSTTDRELEYVLRHCDARGVIVGAQAAESLDRVCRRLNELRLLIALAGARVQPASWQILQTWDQALDPKPTFAAAERRFDTDPAMIVYTSGTTGEPKGVTLSHLNVVANTTSIVEYLRLKREDRVMAVLPFPYVYGKSLLNTHFYVGGTVVIDNRFVFPNAVLGTMQREKVTGFAGVPSTFATLLNKSKFAELQWPDLRYVTQAGGAMAPALTTRLLDAIPRVEIYVMYGATEASARLSYLHPKDLPRKIGSIGKAIPNVELKVIGENSVELRPGETGEIVARGPNMMLGYWNDPEATESVRWRDGIRTGDLGYRDHEGFFYIVGRNKEMIKTSGYRVGPKEVEEVLLEVPAIVEAAVVGVPHDELGECVVAFVVPREPNSVSAEQLIQHCRRRLAGYKVPSEIRLLDAIPKNQAGKLDKRALRKSMGESGFSVST